MFSAQANRAIKLFTGVATFATGYYCVFLADYGKQEHVFSGLQRWHRYQIDKMMGIDSSAVEVERIRRRQIKLREQEERKKRQREYFDEERKR